MRAPAPALFRKTLSGFVPVNDKARHAHARFALNQVVELQDRQRRSLPWLARYWVLCEVVAQNMPTAKGRTLTKENVSDLIKIECGHGTLVKRKNGEVWCLPDSISFDAMGPDEWAEFWNRACDFVAAELIPGMQRRGLEDQVAEISALIGLPPSAASAA